MKSRIKQVHDRELDLKELSRDEHIEYVKYLNKRALKRNKFLKALKKGENSMSKLYKAESNNYILIKTDGTNIMIMGKDRVEIDYDYDLRGLREVTDLFEIYKVTHSYPNAVIE